MSASRTYERPAAAGFQALARLAELSDNVATNREVRREHELETAEALLRVVYILAKSKGERRALYASDFFADRKRRPSVDGDDDFPKHAARRIFGFGREWDRKVSDFGVVLNWAMRKELSPRGFRAVLIKRGGIRSLVRGQNRRPTGLTVRTDGKLLEEIRSSFKGDQIYKRSVTIRETPTGVFIQTT